eukprot:964500-Prymnesium_polylepis.1
MAGQELSVFSVAYTSARSGFAAVSRRFAGSAVQALGIAARHRARHHVSTVWVVQGGERVQHTSPSALSQANRLTDPHPHFGVACRRQTQRRTANRR